MIKVLVIDDEPLEGEAIRFLLTKERPIVNLVGIANSGRKGIDMAKTIKPQISFIDLEMPGLDGIQTIELLKEIVPHIKIAIISAHDESDYALKAIHMGVKEYLLKPVRPQRILNAFDNLLHEDVPHSTEKLWEESTCSPAFIVSETVINQLREYIRSSDRQALRKLLCLLFREITTSTNGNINLDLIRTQSIKLATTIIQLITKDDIYSNHELLSLFYNSIVKILASAQTTNTIEKHFIDFIENYLFLINKCSIDTDQELILKAKNFMQENLDKDITLQSVAQHVHLNPFYFSHLFKAKTGSNYIDYLIDLRLEKAKLLLLSSNETIASIAKKVGYLETNSFSRLFKNRFGITPSEYRSRKSDSLKQTLHQLDELPFPR